MIRSGFQLSMKTHADDGAELDEGNQKILQDILLCSQVII